MIDCKLIQIMSVFIGEGCIMNHHITYYQAILQKFLLPLFLLFKTNSNQILVLISSLRTLYVGMLDYPNIIKDCLAFGIWSYRP